MKKIALALLICLNTLQAFPQSNKLDKKMEKAYALANDGKLTEAETYVSELLEKNPEYGNGWDVLGKIRLKLYKQAKLSDNLLSGNVTVTTTDKNGKEVKSENDSLGKALMELLNSVKPSKKAYSKYIYTLRKGTLFSNDAYEASRLLRVYFIDKEVDTAVSKKALSAFNKAEEEFGKKNYEKAMRFYQQAIEQQPDFYKASLYLGDSHYFMGHYIEAIAAFKAAVQKFPDQMEPRKYLIDAYAKEGLYKEALSEAIAAMCVYPDQSAALKLEDAAYLNNQKLNIRFMPRPVFPNKMSSDSGKVSMNEYSEEIKPDQTWTHYVNAMDKIKDKCNQKGKITGGTTLTKSNYLEVYSWEEMLANSSDLSLEEARQMQKDGFLDCYVLISCFHFDLYDQYIDFVSNNKQKVQDYYAKYIVAK